MNITRLNFARARGARILYWHGEKVSTTDALLERCDYMIHPDDAHLEYGPLSTALRESVMYRDHTGWSTLIAAKYACAGLLRIDPFMVFKAVDDTEEEIELFLLFLAELLADEGL